MQQSHGAGMLAAALVAAIVLAACEPQSSAAPAPSPTPSPSAPQVEAVELADGPLEEQPLAGLSAEAVRYLEGREGPLGVAVVVPSRGVVYTWNGHQPFRLASVIKVPIMLAFLDQVRATGGSLSEQDAAVLREMITVSDNDAATALWNRVGGAAGVSAFLRGAGLEEIHPNTHDWGDSHASSLDMAMLFALLADGELLDGPLQDFALAMLTEVEAEQSWGVMAPVLEAGREGLVGMKAGWYPTDAGWWVNSAGVAVPSDGSTWYSMAVFSALQPTMEYGIETIETVARLVYEELSAERSAATR